MLNDLLARNVAWSKQRHDEEPDYFTRLAALQVPKFFWICCSDSRVPAGHWLEPIRQLARAYAVDLGREPDLDCSIGPGHFQLTHSAEEAAQ